MATPTLSNPRNLVDGASQQLDFGCVWVNDHLPVVSEMPGFKQSGYGKNLSMYELEDYMRIKHITIKSG